MQVASISCALFVVIISVTAQYDGKTGAIGTNTITPSTSVSTEHSTTPFPATTNLTTVSTAPTTTNATTHETTIVSPTSKITTTSSKTTSTTTTSPEPKPTESTTAPTPTSSSTPKPTDVSPTAHTKEPSTTSYPPVPQSARHFDGLSFLGGMILAVCLLGIGVFSLKFYRACHEGNYRTL